MYVHGDENWEVKIASIIGLSSWIWNPFSIKFLSEGIHPFGKHLSLAGQAVRSQAALQVEWASIFFSNLLIFFYC